MSEGLINPADPPERRTEKLLQICNVLMRQVEQASDSQGAAYAQFQRAAILEDQVRERTRDLERALDLLNESNARLAAASRATETARQSLANAIETIQEGFALFDAEDVLVMCNSRFGMHMLDIRERLRPGLRFEQYIEMVSRSRFLELPEGEGPEAWGERRMKRHHDRHVIFNVRMIWDRWVQVSEHRTRDGGTVILQTDVTDIIRMERHERGKLLDDQARIVRATLDHISQGVCIFDGDLRLVGWNQRLAHLLAIPLNRLRVGVGFDMLLDRARSEFVFGAGADAAVLENWVRRESPRPSLGFEIRRGTEMIIDVSAQEMPDRGFVMSFTDITREREAILAMARANETLEARVMERTLDLEDALANAERANAARSRFVAAASHDLLQPLSAAKLFVASVADDVESPKARTTLEKAQNALISVEGILGALLDISKLESGKAAVEVGPVRLGPMLAQLRDEFTPLAAKKGIRIDVLPCSATVSSDATYLRRILQNLIGNAVRYTQSGRVLVGARRRGGGLRIEVHDTGPGIPEHEQEAIFREFHRLNARASASEGMGLGLAIVERACALLGHPLDLRSTPGRGTCFSLGLTQTVARRDAPVAGLDLPEPAEDFGPGERIALLVENDAELQRAMALLLEKWGVAVLNVSSGEEALELLEEIGIVPDVMLVDQQLGEGLSGIETVRLLHARYGPRPVRIVTANRSTEVAKACAAAGVEILYKPIETEALESFVMGAPISL
ncbi:PAS-domain containing protein [Frigidibacter sp. MR17.14]|uniref:hybrid sensor histidine kinase/response regulator n=1 Tax=Frigidibacter sp. MR17.14 TaxID=3126509 RepID=UPI003012F65A